MQKRLLHIITLLMAVWQSAQAQYYEQWLDGDYNHHTRNAYNGESITTSIDASSLAPGLHFYNIRFQDGSGLQGSVNRLPFIVPGIMGAEVADRYEYWIDGDYNGKRTASSTAGAISVSIDASSLAEGLHYFNIRGCDKHGVWGSVNRYLFMVSAKELLQVTTVEYWIDDRNSETASVSDSDIHLTVNISMLEPGSHRFNCRAQASNGVWSDTYSSEFTVEAPVLQEAFIEYFIDTDPGYGKASLVKEIESGENKIRVDLANTSAGAHVLYLRSRDEYGQWSTTTARPLFVQKKHDEEFMRMEYFFDDADPGHGKATSLSGYEKGMQSVVSTLSVEGLLPGSHLLNVRGMDASGLWSTVTSRPFLVIAVQPAIPFVEYFFDEDPGYGKGTAVMDTEAGVHQIAIDLGNLTPGAHLLYVRSRNEAGQWSVTVSRPLYVCRQADIVALEYFFDDNDPGRGKATGIPLPSDKKSQIVFEVKLDGLAVGDHLLNVRTKDSRGHWSAVMQETFHLTTSTRINGVEVEDMPIAIFTLSGHKTQHTQHGVNIIRRKDGKTYKKITK